MYFVQNFHLVMKCNQSVEEGVPSASESATVLCGVL